MCNLNKLNLSDIDGVGEKTIKLLNDNGIYDVNDLIYFFPYKYDIIKRTDMSLIKDGSKVVIDGCVEGQATLLTLSKYDTKIIFRLNSGKSTYNVGIFNNPSMMDKLKLSVELTIMGYYDKMQNCIIADRVKFEKLPLNPVIEPMYLTFGVSSKLLNKYIIDALNKITDIEDDLPIDIQNKYNFKDKISTLKDIHNPFDISLLKKSRQRYKYEELFKYLLECNKYLNKETYKITRNISYNKYMESIDNLPVNIKNALENIISDMKENNIRRLLQTNSIDDKIDVISYVVYYNYLCGYQTLIFDKSKYIRDLIKKRITKYFSKEVFNNDMVIITDNIDNISINKLSLVICDVNDRFNLYNNKKLLYKNNIPDYLFIKERVYSKELLDSLFKDVTSTNINIDKEVYTTDIVKNIKIEDIINESLSNNHGLVIYLKRKKLDVIKDYLEDYEDYVILNNPNEKEEVYKNFNDKKIKILVTIYDDYINIRNNNIDLLVIEGNLFRVASLNEVRNKILNKNSKCIIATNDITGGLKYLKDNNNSIALSEFDMKSKLEYNFIDRADIFRLVNINKDYNMIDKVDKDVTDYVNKELYIDIC